MKEVIVLCCALLLLGCAIKPVAVAQMPEQSGPVADGRLTAPEVQAIDLICGPVSPDNTCPGARISRNEN